MVASRTLQAILEVENDSELLGFRCKETGMALWPLVRSPLLRMIMSDWLYRTPLVLESSPGASRVRVATSLWKATLHNALYRNRLRGRVAIRATGAGQVRRNGLSFNRLSDHFADVAPDETVVLEDLFDWNWPSPRRNTRVLYSTPTAAISALYGRVPSACLRKQAGELVEFLLQRANRLLAWTPEGHRAAWFLSFVQASIARTPFLVHSYETTLRRLGSRLVLIEEACYGGRQACLVRAARQLGITTAEYQHGAISSGHDAYNVAEAMRGSSLYRELLPDYLLTYGTWWSAQITVPVETVTIGNPHRSETIVANCLPQVARDTILVLGDGTETDTYVGLAQELRQSLRSRFRVRFRPHPQERQSFFARQSQGEFLHVDVDNQRDIYDSFGAAHAVVSEISTGLFEAVGLVPRIFMWSTTKSRFAFPTHPFSSFDDAQGLASQILAADSGEVGAHVEESIWASNWRQRYQEFLERV